MSIIEGQGVSFRRGSTVVCELAENELESLDVPQPALHPKLSDLTNVKALLHRD